MVMCAISGLVPWPGKRRLWAVAAIAVSKRSGAIDNDFIYRNPLVREPRIPAGPSQNDPDRTGSLLGRLPRYLHKSGSPAGDARGITYGYSAIHAGAAGAINPPIPHEIALFGLRNDPEIGLRRRPAAGIFRL